MHCINLLSTWTDTELHEKSRKAFSVAHLLTHLEVPVRALEYARASFAFANAIELACCPISNRGYGYDLEGHFFKSDIQFKTTLICWRSGASGKDDTRKRLPSCVTV